MPDGYHPTLIGDTLNGRYTVVHKLGFGGYPTIWLAQDHELHIIEDTEFKDSVVQHRRRWKVWRTPRTATWHLFLKSMVMNIAALSLLPQDTTTMHYLTDQCNSAISTVYADDGA